MLILVANLGSTSFKYRLFEMTEAKGDAPASETCLAKGSVDRIGQSASTCRVEVGEHRDEQTRRVADHSVAVAACFDQLTDPKLGVIEDANQVAAIGLKAVHGGRLSGVFIVNDEVLQAMAEMNLAAPAHNPPYIAAMKTLAKRFPELPLVAAFETDFHRSIPAARREYAIPRGFANDLNIRKYGFHGASHRFIATEMAELLEREDAKIISCHLGGSSSLTAIDSGRSVMTTMGMTPQTGLPQNNRVGDFDPFAIPMMIEKTGWTLDQTLAHLASEGGLLGLSGLSADMRDLENAAEEGHEGAKLAIDTYVEEIRRHLGGMMVALGRVDAIVFTGGIGEKGTRIREAVCGGLENYGIKLDADANGLIKGEGRFDAFESRTELWVVPTNEEIIVARQTLAAIQPILSEN